MKERQHLHRIWPDSRQSSCGDILWHCAWWNVSDGSSRNKPPHWSGRNRIHRRSIWKNRYAIYDDPRSRFSTTGDRFKEQMSKFIDFSQKEKYDGNNDWLLDSNYIELFLREVGAHFSVNRGVDSRARQTENGKGLSLEFNYILIMQAYDFYALYQKYGCNLQFGGDDQWSNMLAGTELDPP